MEHTLRSIHLAPPKRTAVDAAKAAKENIRRRFQTAGVSAHVLNMLFNTSAEEEEAGEKKKKQKSEEEAEEDAKRKTSRISNVSLLYYLANVTRL